MRKIVRQYSKQCWFNVKWGVPTIVRASTHEAGGRLIARSREFSKQQDSGLDFAIALKFDRHIGGIAAEMTVKCHSDTTIITTNLAASRLHEILRHDVRSLSE